MRNTLIITIATATISLSGASWAASPDPCTVPEDERPPQTEPVTVCGTTIISGVGGGTIRLSLPESATLDLSADSHNFDLAEIEGGGPMVGFVLTNDWDALPPEEERSFYAVRMAPGYFGDFRIAVGQTTGGTSKRFTLPPGAYSLYLISDGSPVTVKLPFEQRPGEVSALTERSTQHSVKLLENRAPDPAGLGQTSAISVGESGDFGPGGFMLMWVSATEGLASIGDHGDYCLYRFIPSDEDTAYWPGCPATYMDNGSGYHITGLGIGGGMVATAEPRGERAHGYFHATATTGIDFRAVSLRLWYDLEAAG